MNKSFRYNKSMNHYWSVWYDEPVKCFDVENFIEADRLISLFVKKDFREIDNIISRTDLNSIKECNYYFISNIPSENLNKIHSKEKIIRWMIKVYPPEDLIRLCLISRLSLKILLNDSCYIFKEAPSDLLMLEEERFEKAVGQISINEVLKILYKEITKNSLNIMDESRPCVTSLLGFYLYYKYKNLRNEQRV